VEIRTMTDADAGSVLRLNADSVWALSPLDAVGLQQQRTDAALTLVCELEGQVAAFAIAYTPGAPYASVNYAWHAARFENFVYLDRIAVDPAFRRRGIAGAIYDVVEKTRERGRGFNIATRVVFGTMAAVMSALGMSKACRAINTAFVERENATDRHCNARKARKTYRSSKDWRYHEAVTYLTLYAYNFCWPVRPTRRIRKPDSQLIVISPNSLIGVVPA